MLEYFRKQSIILDMILSSIVIPSWKNITICIFISVFSILYIMHLFIAQKDQRRIDDYANGILDRAKQSSFQVSTSLILANKSKLKPCSVEDMKILRETLISYPYVEDIGRINKNNEVMCTVLWGNLSPKIKLPNKHINNLAFDNIWKLIDSPLVPNQQRYLFNIGNSIAIASPATFVNINRYDKKTGAVIYGVSNKYIYYTFDDITLKQAQDITTFKHTKNIWLPNSSNIVKSTMCLSRYDLCVGAIDIKVGIYDISFKALILTIIIGVVVGVFIAFAIQFFKSNRHSLLYRLKYALKQGQFYSLYQPKINLKSGEIVGVEALARWDDKELGSLSPDTFISCAEKNKIITALTKQLFSKNLKQIAPFLKKYNNFTLSVNLSIQDISDKSFLDFVESETLKNDVNPNQIIFEVTERSAAENNILKITTKRFLNKGYKLSLDDFGTGFSNLSWLTAFEPNEIKVDKMFIQSIGTQSISSITLSGIFQLIGKLTGELVFEGIETVEEVDYIIEHCPEAIGQGWLYSKAVSVDKLKYLMEIQPYTAPDFLESHRI